MQAILSPPLAPYDEPATSKRARLLSEFNELTYWHAEHCEPYRRILSAVCGGQTDFESLEQLPALPVRLFKTIDLSVVPASEIVNTLTSSGTTSQQPSKIFLDKTTAAAQTRALIFIMKSFLGSKRLPMAIIDNAAVVNQRDAFSVRGTTVLGISSV